LARHAGIVVIAGGHGVAMIIRSPNFVIISGSRARRQCRWSGRLSDAAEAKETGVPLKIAPAWRAAGFIVPDAALLIQDGWDPRGSGQARHEGTADDHCRKRR